MINMVKLNGPMFSLGASGTLGKAITFASWKGRAYARGTVIPANPKAEKQLSVRAMMTFLSQNWTAISPGDKATWQDQADANVMSTFNAYIAANLATWRNFQGISQTSPFTRAQTTIVPGAASATNGVRMITVTMPVTVTNSGWAVLFFRKKAAPVTQAFDNLVHVGLVDGVNDIVFVDTPLDPATYHYNFYCASVDGKFEVINLPVNATATA